MKKSYAHLTLEQRCLIFGLRSSGKSLRAIGEEIKVDASTVCRELQRNRKISSIYNPKSADKISINRRKSRYSKGVGWNPELRGKIMYLLTRYHSPEQIAGSLKKEGYSINHETIYQFIWQDKSEGGKLYTYLRHRNKPYKKRGRKKGNRSIISDRIDISLREEIVDTKSRIGDWEADTIIGKGHKGAIVSVVERRSKIALFKKVEHNNKDLVTKAIIELLKPYKDKVHTITFDNGKEFAGHKKIATKLKTSCYFAKPYSAWQRGLNEHTNGLLRQFIPKKTDFRVITNQMIDKYQNLINNRPRKILQFETPIEVFNKPQNVALRS